MKHILSVAVLVLAISVAAFGQANFFKEVPQTSWPASMSSYTGQTYASSATHTLAPIVATEVDSMHFGIAFPDTFSISKIYFYTYPSPTATVGKQLTDTIAAVSGSAATYLYYNFGVRFATQMGAYVKPVIYFAGSGNDTQGTAKYRFYYKGFRRGTLGN